MTPEIIASVAGVILSLALAYVPGLNDRYAALDGAIKRAITGGLLIVAAGGALALGCAGLGEQLGVSVTCDQGGAVEAARALIAALVANQGAYLLLVRPGDGPSETA